MKRATKNILSVAITLGLLGGTGIALGGPAAAAPSCSTATTSSLSNYTAVWMSYNAGKPSCFRVQARMDRLVGGSQPILTRLGLASSTMSDVSETQGTNAGNKARHQQTTTSAWSAWRTA